MSSAGKVAAPPRRPSSRRSMSRTILFLLACLVAAIRLVTVALKMAATPARKRHLGDVVGNGDGVRASVSNSLGEGASASAAAGPTGGATTVWRRRTFNRTYYTCGWEQGRLGHYLFGSDHDFGGRLDSLPCDASNDTDIVLYGKFGNCSCTSRVSRAKFLVINGEGPYVFHDGRRPMKKEYLRGFFGITVLLAQYSQEQWDWIIKHNKKRVNTLERYLIYLADNCRPKFRDEAFRRLSEVGSSPAYYGSRCRGGDDFAANASASRVLPTPDGEVTPRDKEGATRSVPWRENYLIFQRYRFCLVMENKNRAGYLSEKLVVGFLGGCIPIYYGSRGIFDVFSERAFVFYDPQNPRPALDRVAYLERNRTAYDEALREPILANGERTVEKHFSYAEELGGGVMRRKVREFMGIPT